LGKTTEAPYNNPRLAELREQDGTALMNPRDELARLTPELRRYARGVVFPESEDRSEAADRLVQETIVRGLRVDWSGRQANMKIWLYATLTSLNRARLRGAQAHDHCAEETGANPRPLASFGTRAPAIMQALDRMGCDEREALVLIAVEGFPYAEACEVLKIVRPTLIARLARARRFLAESLEFPHAQDNLGRRARSPHLRLVK